MHVLSLLRPRLLVLVGPYRLLQNPSDPALDATRARGHIGAAIVRHFCVLACVQPFIMQSSRSKGAHVLAQFILIGRRVRSESLILGIQPTLRNGTSVKSSSFGVES